MDKDVLKVEVLEGALYQAAISPDVSRISHDRPKPYESTEIQSLLQKKRESTTSIQRRAISKQIQKVSRKLVRKYNDEKVEEILKEFADLGRLDNIQHHSQPKKETSTKIDAEKFTD